MISADDTVDYRVFKYIGESYKNVIFYGGRIAQVYYKDLLFGVETILYAENGKDFLAEVIDEGEIVMLKELIKKAEEKGIVVTIVQDLKENREHSYWYGGTVAKLEKGNVALILEANGDMIATLVKMIDGNVFETYSKDRNNHGEFYNNLFDEISDDTELFQVIENAYKEDESDEDKYPRLEIENNNWWEVVAEINGDMYDLMCDLDVEKYSEALDLLIEDFDEYAKVDI